MSRSIWKPQLLYTFVTVANYGILAYIVNSQNALLKVGKLYQVPILAFFEVFKLSYIRRNYGIQGSSNVSSKLVTGGAGATNIASEGLKFAGLHLGCILLYSFICFILGAPVLTDLDATLTLASILTCLTVLPFALFLGTRSTMFLLSTNQLEMVTQVDDAFLKFLEGSAMGALLGAWAASVVMPLDWDREWQVYPLPNVVGAILGHAAGCVFSILRGFLVKLQKDVKKSFEL